MTNLYYPSGDALLDTIQTFSEDAYIFCAPETEY